MSLQQLNQDKFIVCEDFIEPSVAKSLAKNFQSLCEAHSIPGDSQVPLSNAVYCYHPFLQLLYDRVHYMNQKLGIYVFPTYTYARIYKRGSDLPVHRDRDACELSVTLNLDGDREWPIYFQGDKEEKIPVVLHPGQAAIYLGREVPHWRDPYEGTHYSQVFLHYVNSTGPFAHCIHDAK